MPVQTRSKTKREQLKQKLREECLRKKAEMDAEWSQTSPKQKLYEYLNGGLIYKFSPPAVNYCLVNGTEILIPQHLMFPDTENIVREWIRAIDGKSFLVMFEIELEKLGCDDDRMCLWIKFRRVDLGCVFSVPDWRE